MSQGIDFGERATVVIDGEEYEVFDHVSVEEYYYVNSVNGYEAFEPQIFAGNNPDKKPEAVTERVARLLWGEFGIDLDNRDDIEVVDMDEAEVV